MQSVDRPWLIGLALLVTGSACSPPAKKPDALRPQRIPGYVMPPAGDSVIKEGPLKGRILRLECDPYLGHLESGDDARCILRSGIVEGNTTRFAELDSLPEMLVANPNVVAAPRPGSLYALAPGYSEVWVTYDGGIARDFATIGPRQGPVTFFPRVTDTTIQLGQTYRFRLSYHDSAGREQLDARQATMSLVWWGQPGRFDTVGLNVFEITPREMGKVEVRMARGRRHSTVTVNVAAAPKAAAPVAPSSPKQDVVPVLVRAGGAAVQIQVIDAVSSPRPIPISIDGKVFRTDKDGWYRGRSDPGTLVVAVHCPSMTLPAGPVVGDTTLSFVSGQNPPMRVHVSSAQCDAPGERQVQGTFVGHYRNGREETFTPCRPLRSSGDSTRQVLVAIEAPGFVPKRLDDTARYFARFQGTLTGPGSYGASKYYLRVTSVLELRAARADDCD